MLRWLCELGRINTRHETSLLSQYMASPRHGQLLKVFNIFKYLKTHDKRSWMVFDPMRYDVEWVPFGEEAHPLVCVEALKDMYDISKLEQPHNMPEVRG